MASVFKSINPGDVNVTPFQSYKNWTVSNTDYSSSGYVVLSGLHTVEKTPINSIEAANDPTNSYNGMPQSVVWKSIDHMYYRFPYDPAKTTELYDRTKTTKFLFVSASTITFPYLKSGKRIKPGSVTVESIGTNTYTLSDDGNGNIYDPEVDSSSFAPKSNLVGYWGFNNEFRRFRKNYGSSLSQDIFRYNATNSTNIVPNQLIFEKGGYTDSVSTFNNISFQPGITTTGSSNINTGIQANFSGDGYILTNSDKLFDFGTCDEFAISCWINLPISQSVTSSNDNYIISKRVVVDNFVYDKATAKYVTQEVHQNFPNYPFQVSVYNQNSANGTNAGKLITKRSDGINLITVTSSIAVTGSQYHILYQKTGSILQLYVNGVLNGSANDTVNSSLVTPAKLLFGAYNKSGSNGLSGSLDEIRIYNTALTQPQISSLANIDYISGSAYQTNVVGNMFYTFGQCVVSSCMPKYNDVFKNTWNVNYKSTHTIYEHEIFITVPKDIFNNTMNPTATYKKSVGSGDGCTPRQISEPGEFILPDFTGSLTPYISTIGLYNESGELVVVCKLAQPIQKRKDIDMNFVIRYDI